MPCYDSRNDPSYAIEAARESFRHNSDVAEMLCALCAAYAQYFGHNKEPYPSTETGVLNAVHPKLGAWWKEHKARDDEERRRKRQEANRKLAEAEVAKVAAAIFKKHGVVR